MNKVIHKILYQLSDISLEDLIFNYIFDEKEEYFERFPKFIKYNDYDVPCGETYAYVFNRNRNRN